MEWAFYIFLVLVLVSAVGAWAAIEYSMPAPDWYEIEERNRRNWYK